ncbi:MAG: SDR family oxidoreductase [Phycicoccus sp.]
MNLAGRTVLVTGGARGIGRELSLQIVAAGARVVAVGRAEAHLEALRATLDGDGDQLSTIVADLADPECVEALLAEVRERHPSLSVVVNNAGVQRLTDFVAEDPAVTLPAMRHEVAVNLTAVVAVTAGLLPLLAAQSSAAVVNVTSGLAIAPKRSAPVYCATKAAVRSFTRALRYQCEAGAPGVRVVDVVMPLVDTDMTRGRGRSAITPEAAARATLDGLCRGSDEVLVGRSSVLGAAMRLSPRLAYRLLRDG